MILQIITPKGKEYEGEVRRVQFTSTTGLMEILDGHAPMIAAVCEGSIVTDVQSIVCGKGVLRVENNIVTAVCE